MRHRNWYAGIAAQGERAWFTPRQTATVGWMTTESGNLRAALEYSLTTPGDADTGRRMAATLLEACRTEAALLDDTEGRV